MEVDDTDNILKRHPLIASKNRRYFSTVTVAPSAPSSLLGHVFVFGSNSGFSTEANQRQPTWTGIVRQTINREDQDQRRASDFPEKEGGVAKWWLESLAGGGI